MRLSFSALLTLACLAGLPSFAVAQDDVRLSEIVPALENTELGAISVGAAPAPGSTRVIHRSEVIAALRRAGRTADGLAIPRTVRIRRAVRRVEPAELASLASRAVREALSPCEVASLSVQTPANVSDGALDIQVEANPPTHSGAAPVLLVLNAGGQISRVPAQARVTCPPPIVQPGARIEVRARFGNVSASAPAIARQPGRVGDVIRVSTVRTQAPLRARIMDASHAEVVQ
ncbi:MAG: flagella basal body P-ring formation protein FlgA [Sandaracinaceae bacterium]